MTPLDNNSAAGRATFTAQLGDLKCAASGSEDAKNTLTVRGHAAVTNRLSHDLGGYRVKIAPGAFDRVLDTNPDVHLVIDHDTRYVLARTKNKTLELRTDPYGLHIWARMANTTYAQDLALLMEGGYVDQMSFACDIGSSEWSEDDAGNITRTINEVDALYDVTICAQGAFPQTDSQLVASLKDAGADLASAVEAGLVSRREVAAEAPGQDGIAQDPEVVEQPDGEPAGAAGVALTPNEVREANGFPAREDEKGSRDLAALKRWARARHARLNTD